MRLLFPNSLGLVRCSNRRCRAFVRRMDACCPVCRKPGEEGRFDRVAATLLFRVVLPAVVVALSLGLAWRWRARNEQDLKYAHPQDPWRSVPAQAAR